MADFDWANEGGLAALGAGIKGFAQGMMDGEDRKVKRLEMEAKSEAQKFERERNAFLDQMTMREKGYKKDAAGQAVPDVAHRTGEAITKLAPSGLDPTMDAEGNVASVSPNDELLKAKRKGAGGTGGPGGGKQLPPAQVLSVQEGQQIPKMLKDITVTLENRADMFGPIKGRIGSANEYDTDAQTIDGQMRTASQAFGKYMEGGVLRKEDEDKYRKMFPQLKDTPELAKNKLAIVNKLLVDKHNANIAGLGAQGYSTRGFQKLDEGQLPGLLSKGLIQKKGILDAALPQANAGDQKMQVDPQIEKWAKENNLDYAAAKAIIDKRKAGK